MEVSYLFILAVVFIATLGLDLIYTHILYKYRTKLLLTLLFIFGVFISLDYLAVSFNLWGFPGQGLVGVYIVKLPIEEFLFMIIAPFGAIVVWEAFHKAIKKR